MERGEPFSMQRSLVPACEAVGEMSVLAVTTLAARRHDLAGLGVVVDAARERSAKLKHREIGERASSLVVTNLIEQLGLRAEGLIEIARDASHGLEHRQVGAVHPSGAMRRPARRCPRR